MEFASSEDIAAPLDAVFAELSDFDAIERQILRRGVQIERHGDFNSGMSWDATFSFRGKSRDAKITLTDYTPPDHMEFQSVSSGLTVQSRVEFVPLSRTQTRVSVRVTLDPRTLSARLMVQSMKLARNKLNARFAKRMKEFARDLERRLQTA